MATNSLMAVIILPPFLSAGTPLTNQNAIAKSQFIIETAPFPSGHASAIAETGCGLVAAWFGGTAAAKGAVKSSR